MDPTPSAKAGQGETILRLSGDWTVNTAAAAEAVAEEIAARATARTLDLSGLGRLDTAGAWIIDRTRAELAERGVVVAYAGARPEHQTLLSESQYRVFDEPERVEPGFFVSFFGDIGQSVVAFGRDLATGVAFLGEVVKAVGATAVDPSRLRPASLVFHLESFAFRSVPIIALISLLVGAIVAQQGIFQLQKFGAVHFAVDMAGLLVLRELGVLLASIMMAGRSGSAITAEIGSMKMREEIDAMRVMGFDPIEMLIAPRILALMIALPMLTFIADMAAIFGALIVATTYGEMAPDIFFARLQSAIGVNTFLVGLIKAPFMALVIGLIASIEGFGVKGSAESLGRQVTASVVKAIFMVILVDGLFAMFFAAIRY
ncbi:MAG: ABC transporter permease [Methylobacteriaceae bacterium]|nr:ABC transporter permease [Methylobacteriaceae bacterium]